MGAGGTLGQKGVAILLHNKWKKAVCKFMPINEGVCYANMALQGKGFSLIAVYMPHGGCNNNEVEQTYGLISGAVRQAWRSVLIAIAGGDWNACVGHKLETEDSELVGGYDFGSRNLRGSWMAQWCLIDKMSIINMRFEKDLNQRWSYTKGQNRRLLDYACVEVHAIRLIEDAEASDDISVGRDHRAVKLILEFQIRGKTNNRRVCKKEGIVTIA